MDEEETAKKFIEERIARIIAKERPHEFTTSHGLLVKLQKFAYAEEHFASLMRNQEHLAPWMVWLGSYKSVEDSVSYLTFMEECHANLTKLDFGIWDNEKLIGSIAYPRIDLGISEGEIGYWLDKNYQGRGIITNCVEALVKIGFEVLELNEIVIRCMKENYKSAKIPLRLGFTEVSQTRNEIEEQENFRKFVKIYSDNDQP